MWITQTYVKSPEPDAPLHIYYLFENYRESHRNATRRVQQELESLSDVYPDICFLMPNPASADLIEGELRRNQKLWKRLSDFVPGMVISRKPIETLDSTSDEIFIVPLNYAGFSERGMGLLPNSKRFAEAIQRLRSLITEDLDWQHREIGRYEAKPTGWLARIVEAVELKPGIAGFRLDLKKLYASRDKR